MLKLHRLRWLFVAILAVAVFGAATACGDDDVEDGDSAATAAATEANGSDDLASLPVDREMTVEMRDIAFEPTAMSMRTGEVVEMTFHNAGAQLHDFTIDEMDAEVMEMMPGGGMAAQGHMDDDMPRAMHMAVEAGQQGVMRLRVHEPGEYEYYCTVPGHREAGMHGTLTVE